MFRLKLAATTGLLGISAFVCTSPLAQPPRRVDLPAIPPAVALQGSPPLANNEGTDGDSQPARAFKITVRHLFQQEKFEQLDTIASTVRSQKERFLGGGWKLSAFYKAIQEPGSLTATDALWTAHFERLQRWSTLRPDSITPRVALAESYLRFAWKARGSGFGNTVTPEGWKFFRERVQQARDTLEQAASRSAKDAQWYHAMQTVALAQGWDRGKADDLVQLANGNEPGYFYFYEAHANYLLPKWYGKSGDAEAFAQAISDRMGGPEGDFIYFEVIQHLNCCKAKPQMPDLSWERVKQGFSALEQLYGSTNYQRNAMAFMAVRQGDRDFAQQLFARIGDNWDEQVWGQKVRFDQSKISLTLIPADDSDGHCQVSMKKKRVATYLSIMPLGVWGF